jgi:hypothetical protein
VAPEHVVLEDEPAAETTTVAVQPARQPGDWLVLRFSGGFHKTPLILEEKVVAWEEDVLVTDWTLEEGVTRSTLRVRTRPADANAIVSVSRPVDDAEAPATIADWEAMTGRTAFAADTNEGLIDAAQETCTVAGRVLECRKVVYQVTVGDADATLTVMSSDELPGRDVAGEIVGADGKLIYRAELIEMGRGAEATATAAAD